VSSITPLQNWYEFYHMLDGNVKFLTCLCRRKVIMSYLRKVEMSY
jgi:hypothetical protein